jgi:hypothetical protein
MLDRLVEQRREVIDQSVREPDAAEERQRQLARSFEGLDIDERRPVVVATCQIEAFGQVNIDEDCLVQTGTSEICL